jgi:hypothetical protein
MNYDPIEKKFQYNTPNELDYDEDLYIEKSVNKSIYKNQAIGSIGHKGYVPE